MCSLCSVVVLISISMLVAGIFQSSPGFLMGMEAGRRILGSLSEND